jgi:hypothetical protein
MTIDVTGLADRRGPCRFPDRYNGRVSVGSGRGMMKFLRPIC